MPFAMKPADAFLIDVSGVEDVERERLKLTFENGKVLLFKVQRSGKKGVQPWLLLDHGDVAGPGFGDARELIKQLSRTFYLDKVARTLTRRALDRLRRLWNSDYHVSFEGWTQERVEKELMVELFIGHESKPSSLCSGRSLEISYGTQYSNPTYRTVPWGYVRSIETYVIPPTAAVSVANVT